MKSCSTIVKRTPFLAGKHMALYGCSKTKGENFFGSTENQGHYFFTELLAMVGARDFLVRDLTLLHFGVRRREDNHKVKYIELEGALEPSGCTSPF